MPQLSQGEIDELFGGEPIVRSSQEDDVIVEAVVDASKKEGQEEPTEPIEEAVLETPVEPTTAEMIKAATEGLVEEPTGEVVEEPGQEEPGAQAPTLEEREAQLTEREAHLYSMLNQLAAVGISVPVPPTEASTAKPTPEAAVQVETPQVPQTPREMSAPAILTEEQFADVIASPENFEHYVQDRIAYAQQRILASVPVMVSRQLNTLQQVSAFFQRDENKDLLPVAAFVQRIAVDVESANPRLSVEQLLLEAATRTRSALKLGQTKPVTTPSTISTQAPIGKRLPRAGAAFAPPTAPRTQRVGAIKTAVRGAAGIPQNEWDRMASL